MSKGRLLVIEGLDGSGKATQAKLLASHLAESGCKVMEITFPDYESDSSALVKIPLRSVRRQARRRQPLCGVQLLCGGPVRQL